LTANRGSLVLRSQTNKLRTVRGAAERTLLQRYFMVASRSEREAFQAFQLRAHRDAYCSLVRSPREGISKPLNLAPGAARAELRIFA
jgi:hypothetical protein